MNTISFTRGAPPREALPSQGSLMVGLDTNEWLKVMSYGDAAGHPWLREVIGEQYGVSSAQVIASNGSLQLLCQLASQLPGMGIYSAITEYPTYDRARKALAMFGARVLGIRVQADGIDVDELYDFLLHNPGPHLLYLVPDFQNPTGVTLSLEKRVRIADLADEFDLLVVEDIPYRQLRYRGEDVPLLRTFNPKRVLTLGSYSKLIAPGPRAGFGVGERDLIELLRTAAADTCISPVLLTQALIALFVRRGELKPFVEGLKVLYSERCDAAGRAVREHLPGAEMFESDGGFFRSITLPEEANVDGLVQRARELGLLLTDGRDFCPELWTGSSEGARFVRIPFVGLTPDEIFEGVGRLRRAACL